jgi:hypothetical protein
MVYIPKKNYIDRERLSKLIKDTIKYSEDDRKLAFTIYELLKERYESNVDTFAKADIIRSLDAMREATSNIVKLIELGFKYDIEIEKLKPKDADKLDSTFEALDNIENENQAKKD